MSSKENNNNNNPDQENKQSNLSMSLSFKTLDLIEKNFYFSKKLPKKKSNEIKFFIRNFFLEKKFSDNNLYGNFLLAAAVFDSNRTENHQ